MSIGSTTRFYYLIAYVIYNCGFTHLQQSDLFFLISYVNLTP